MTIVVFWLVKFPTPFRNQNQIPNETVVLNISKFFRPKLGFPTN